MKKLTPKQDKFARVYVETTNAEALQLERSLILRIGTDNLLNSMSGVRNANEMAYEMGRDLLERMVPKDAWLAWAKTRKGIINPYYRSAEFYDDMVSEIKENMDAAVRIGRESGIHVGP